MSNQSNTHRLRAGLIAEADQTYVDAYGRRWLPLRDGALRRAMQYGNGGVIVGPWEVSK